ncbi:MAG: type II toxin-antitoxin system ParD family antitoxin [Porphyrobacter sp.]|nr:type II toxin-antitoxin system ParD family antitoxin [Porphyrobacter sp.]
MGKNTSIVLGEHFEAYARRKVESGEFSSTSEVVREALRLHEQRSQFRDKLLEAIDKGLASPVDAPIPAMLGVRNRPSAMLRRCGTTSIRSCNSRCVIRKSNRALGCAA